MLKIGDIFMNTKDLKSFKAVYEERSINQAAKKLFITPQGLSKNIRALETELDTVLFERTRQGVKPTESACLLYDRAEVLIRQFKAVENGIRQLKNRGIVLRIGCACGVFNVLPFRLVQRFTEENSRIRVEWNEYPNQEVKERVADSKLEYGVIVGEWKEPGISQRKLASREIYLLVYEGHPFYGLDQISFDKVRDENLILMNEHFHMFQDFIEACLIRGFKPRIVAKTADPNFLYKLCLQKFGLAVVPGFVLEDFRLDHVKALPFREKLKWDVYGAFREDNRNYEAVRLFDEFLKQNT
ncbi:LysR family transcriptional regulator [Clostridium sp. Marseille-P2415]|uniref:LysR family transcriptional regulator n=1 Tax=Clostridium sp. Marseille-P2415 TaxID=1805471 RepID=UPI001F2D3761|nr:LysR family transcriptional regulator [Clostridium sp. Marseille-P2415]